MCDPVRQSIHVVQITFDETVLWKDAASDTLHRQALYADELDRCIPGSRLSVIVLTRHKPPGEWSSSKLALIPVQMRKGIWRYSLLLNLLRVHRELPIDVIAPQTIFDDAWVALAAGSMTRAKVVGQIHTDIFSPFARLDLGRGIIGRLRLALGLRLMRREAAVRVVAHRLKAEILSRGLHTVVWVVPVAVTLEAKPPPTSGEELCQVLYVGRLVEAKNLFAWISVAQAVARSNPDATFAIAGDGPLRRALNEYAHSLSLGDRIRFLGAMQPSELASIYARSAVFLLTSDYEGFCRVLVEAGLSGLAVVAPRLTGPEDIVVDGQTGFLHQPGDLHGMAESVLRLLGEPALRVRMGMAARRHVEETFNPQRLISEWVGLLISVAEASGEGEPQ
jgi:glycosyltransferase involved in cell wall biosynthesis